MNVKVEKIVRAIEELEITGATLLSVEEAKGLPERLRKYSRCWWLRSPGFTQGLAADVDDDGDVYSNGISVDYGNSAVRPALKISNLKSSNFKIGDVFIFGGKNFEIISDNLAFYLEDIGCYCFRRDWKAVNANDYEKSDVKKFIDNWFENACEANEKEPSFYTDKISSKYIPDPNCSVRRITYEDFQEKENY